MARVSQYLQDFRVYGYGINGDMSIRKMEADRNMYFPELYTAGLHAGTCCYEFTMVRSCVAKLHYVFFQIQHECLEAYYIFFL